MVLILHVHGDGLMTNCAATNFKKDCNGELVREIINNIADYDCADDRYSLDVYEFDEVDCDFIKFIHKNFMTPEQTFYLEYQVI